MGNNTPLGCYCPPPYPLINGIFITLSRPPQGGAEEKRRALAGTFNRRSPPSRSPSGGKRRGRNSEKIPLRAIFVLPHNAPAPALQTCPPRAYLARAVHPRYNRIFAPQIALFASVLPPTCLRHASHRIQFPAPVSGGDRRHQPAAPAHRPPHPAGNEKSPAHARLP